jgi:hypothetical protein
VRGLSLLTTEGGGLVKSRKHRDCPSQRTLVKRSTFRGFGNREIESEESPKSRKENSRKDQDRFKGRPERFRAVDLVRCGRRFQKGLGR